MKGYRNKDNTALITFKIGLLKKLMINPKTPVKDNKIKIKKPYLSN